MTIEKICEYFNEIGLIQLDNINRFLKIYTQLSQNKYKNKSDKLILALFSYITLASKNEQQLYDICKNIVNSFSNNQILSRYKALNIFNNLCKYKIHSKYIYFFSKLNSFIYNKKGKNKYIHLNPKSQLLNYNSKKIIKNDILKVENYNDNNTSMGKNNNEKKKQKIIKKIQNNKKHSNNFRKINHNVNSISDDDKECTFSPKINHYKPKYNSKVNNNNSDFDSSNNNSNDINENTDNSFNFKYIPFKNSINYGYNNKINNEIEKMLLNMAKYNYSQNNTKYLPRKTTFRKQINNIYPFNSENNVTNLDNNNDNDYNNNMIYHYYDEDYDFYEKEKEHVKKVQDKIFQLKLEKLDKMSKECTFSPEINQAPYFENYSRRNNITENNVSHKNYFNNNYINNNYMNKSYINNRNDKISKNKKSKINEDNIDDNYNVYPKKNKKQRPRSYSGSKNENGYSIYKNRKEELSKLFKEKYPFSPNIQYNKNIKIQNTFEQRQEKFIKDKENLQKQKEKEELKQIEEFKKKNQRSKTEIKNIVNKLYNNGLKKKEEKPKKKPIIDWSKKAKQYKKKYPNDFKNNIIHKNKKPIINNENNKKDDKVKNGSSFGKDAKDENNNNGEIIINKKLLMDRIKDEHVIGFKNSKDNDSRDIKNDGNEKYRYKESLNINYGTIDSIDNFGTKTSLDKDREERMKIYKENNLFDNLNNKSGIQSNTMKEMMNKLKNNK